MTRTSQTVGRSSIVRYLNTSFVAVVFCCVGVLIVGAALTSPLQQWMPQLQTSSLLSAVVEFGLVIACCLKVAGDALESVMYPKLQMDIPRESHFRGMLGNVLSGGLFVILAIVLFILGFQDWQIAFSR